MESLDTEQILESKQKLPEVSAAENQNEEKKPLSDAEVDELIVRAKAHREDVDKLAKIKKELGIDAYATTEEIKGNYDGDWTMLLKERMSSSEIREKFIVSLANQLADAPDEYERRSVLDKDINTKKYYYDQIRSYDENLEKAFSYTTYIPAGEANHLASALGTDQENGTIFTDAAIEGRPLTDKEKNEIEAHEKGHVLRSFKGNKQAILASFDFSKIPEGTKRPQYVMSPDELAERMAQLKNYFGFKGNEIFTRQHLSYAKENYLKDGGINNSMDVFFSLITHDTEDKFLETINTYPL